MLPQDILRIAKLARIGISSEQVDVITNSLDNIISWIDQLQKVDVSEIVLHCTDNQIQMHERIDVVIAENLSVLDNAKNSEHGFFVVPKVIE